jgi:hypothetical protein
MPVATITASTLATSPAITQAQLADHLANIFVSNLGYTLLDSFVSTSEHRVLSYQYNASTKGTAYFVFDIGDSFSQPRTWLYDSWNTTNNTGTNAPQNFNTFHVISLNSGVSFNFAAISHPELRAVLITQGANWIGLFGVLRPSTKPSWWNQSTDLYAFIPALIPQSRELRCTTTTLLTNPQKMLANPGLSHFNTNTSSRQIMKEVLLGNDGGNFGIFAKTSADLIMVGGDGLAPGARLIKTAGVEEYMYLGTNNASPYLAIRVI